MSSIAPNSEIWLIKAPIESDNLNHLNFASQTAQLNYFKNLPHITYTKYMYMRHDSSIQIEGNAEDIMRYNYMLYKNAAYGDKWIFAFITNVEFSGNDVCTVYFRTDVFNTWYFDVTFKPSYIEREHTNDDTIGANILNEEIGESEFVMNGGEDVPIIDNNEYYIAVQTTDCPDTMKTYLEAIPRIYAGLASGAWVILLKAGNSAATTNFNNFIKWFDFAGKTPSIIAMYLIPKTMCANAIFTTLTDATSSSYSAEIGTLATTYSSITLANKTYNINTTIDGYTPKNNRLFCYPYNFIRVSNHAGADTVYKWEEFKTTNHQAEFYLHGIPNQGIDTRFIPRNYKYESTNIHAFYDYGLTGGKMPLISWQSDYYLNWQATNGVNSLGHRAEYVNNTYNNTLKGYDLTSYGMDIGGFANAMGDLASGVGQTVGAAVGSAIQFFGAIKDDLQGAGFKAYMTPDTLGGCRNTGDLNFSDRCSTFAVQFMSIKREMAEVVDNFFSMFGYKCLKVKTPNINGRRNWNYVKTKACNIEGDVPQRDMQELKSIFNGGVTIWHNPQTFLDYSQNNDII